MVEGSLKLGIRFFACKKPSSSLISFFSMLMVYLDSPLTNRELLPLLQRSLSNWIHSLMFENGQLVVTVSSNRELLPLLTVLKRSSLFRFTALMDLFGIDFLQRSFFHNRFELNYFLLSHSYLQRLRVRVHLRAEEPIDSVSSLFGSANWLEREVWDMYGVFFFNHPDLRRILTDYGFKGFPLRKDFPLTGYTEVRYSEKRKRVITKPVQLSQEYRYFEFQTPWERFFDK